MDGIGIGGTLGYINPLHLPPSLNSPISHAHTFLFIYIYNTSSCLLCPSGIHSQFKESDPYIITHYGYILPCIYPCIKQKADRLSVCRYNARVFMDFGLSATVKTKSMDSRTTKPCNFLNVRSLVERKRAHFGVIILEKGGVDTPVPGVDFAALEDVRYRSIVWRVLQTNPTRVITLPEMQLI